MLQLEQDLISRAIFPSQQFQHSRKEFGHFRVGSCFLLLGILLLTVGDLVTVK
jgi:hypothetical protein